MDKISILAASGLRARMESLDMLANNLSNAATAGYKTDREFYSLYLGAQNAEASASTLPVIDGQWTDFSQGLLQPTGNPLDFALSGKGFFVVDGPSGQLYTRNGNFRLSPRGELVTTEGYAVRDKEGKKIQVESGYPVELLKDGTIRQNGADLGQLEIIDVANPAVLAKRGSSYYGSTGATARPISSADVEVHQGKIESSNVATPESAVRLVNVMRQFEMLNRAIALNGDMNRKAVEEVARVGQ